MRSVLIFLLLLCNSPFLIAQNGYYITGAGESGIANASTAVHSENPMFHNIAALASIAGSGISFGYDYRGFAEGLNNISLQYIHSGSSINIGGSIFKTGDAVLNEFVASAGVSQKLGIASIGVKVNYHQLYSAPFGYSRASSISAGVLADLSDQITVGAYLNNVGKLEFSEEVQQYYIPTILSMGISYRATNNLLLAVAAAKDLHSKLQLTSGIAYKIHADLILRTGINWYYKNLYYGLGYKVRKLQVDYATNAVSALGQVHSLTVCYTLAKADEEL
ncbi:MAG: hypothetical protein ACNS60_11705 [Candidatus Cyclobacteriaceae bacterium M2_1C_046]